MKYARFDTKADRWPRGKEVAIIVERNDAIITVNGNPVRVEFNGIQLRLESQGLARTYIVFDDRHKPPQPIAEMYRVLTE